MPQFFVSPLFINKYTVFKTLSIIKKYHTNGLTANVELSVIQIHQKLSPASLSQHIQNRPFSRFRAPTEQWAR